MMIFLWLAPWIIAALLLFTDSKSLATRWLSGVGFTAGFGGLSAYISDYLLSYPSVLNFDTVVLEALNFAQYLFSYFTYYGVPYAFIMFSIVYLPGLTLYHYQHQLKYILLIPPTVTLIIDPHYPPDYLHVTLWAVPYMLFGIFHLIKGTVQENNALIKRYRILVCCATVPAITVLVMVSYVLRSLGMDELWRYNAWMMVLTFIVYVISTFTYGFMGLRITFQKQRLDYTLKAITSGTAMLNHAIKNDLGKMKLFCDKIQFHAIESGQEELKQDIQIVMDSAGHIHEMIMRVQEQTQDLAMKMNEHSLSEMVKQVLLHLQPQLAESTVQTDFQTNGVIWGDKVQIMEVFNNLIMNAIESMPSGGEITIRSYEMKRKYVLEIKDTGSGIPKKYLRKVLEPFFTTKTTKKTNFGLGLSYCFSVMKKHGGDLEISSQEQVGTTIYLYFPKFNAKRKLQTV